MIYLDFFLDFFLDSFRYGVRDFSSDLPLAEKDTQELRPSRHTTKFNGHCNNVF